MGTKSKQIKILLFVLADILLINLAALLAVVSRFDFSLANAADTHFFHNMLRYALINTGVTLLVFYAFRLYHSSWITVVGSMLEVQRLCISRVPVLYPAFSIGLAAI